MTAYITEYSKTLYSYYFLISLPLSIKFSPKYSTWKAFNFQIDLLFGNNFPLRVLLRNTAHVCSIKKSAYSVSNYVIHQND